MSPQSNERPNIERESSHHARKPVLVAPQEPITSPNALYEGMRRIEQAQRWYLGDPRRARAEQSNVIRTQWAFRTEILSIFRRERRSFK